MIEIIQKLQQERLVTLEEVKNHLRITTTRDDVYIYSLIETASVMVEDYIDRNLFSKQIKKRFTKNINYNLGNYKISTIDSVKVYKENNEIGDISNYNFDGRILWFSSEETYDYVEIIYTIDSDFELIPLPLKNACLIIIGDLYNNRQEIIIGRSVFNTNIIERILGPYRKTVSL